MSKFFQRGLSFSWRIRFFNCHWFMWWIMIGSKPPFRNKWDVVKMQWNTSAWGTSILKHSFGKIKTQKFVQAGLQNTIKFNWSAQKTWPFNKQFYWLSLIKEKKETKLKKEWPRAKEWGRYVLNKEGLFMLLYSHLLFQEMNTKGGGLRLNIIWVYFGNIHIHKWKGKRLEKQFISLWRGKKKGQKNNFFACSLGRQDISFLWHP